MNMLTHPKRKCDAQVEVLRRTSSSSAIGSFALVLLLAFTVCTFPVTHGFNHGNNIPLTTRINICGRIQSRNPVSACTPLSLLTRTSTSTHTSHSRHPLSASASTVTEIDDKLPSTVTPILLTVLALIVSEGIAISTLPLHLQSMGATPVQVGLSTSAFSIAQMVMCPLIVGLSSRPSVGRRKTLSICLAGAALSSCVIASSSTIHLIIFARFLAGIFAASIPVAQAGVTDLVPPQQATLALSRVSAASQTGLVIGPIASAVVQGLLFRLGVPVKYLVRGVFVASAAFALFVLSLRGDVSDAPSVSNGEERTFEAELPNIAPNSNSSLPLATEKSKNVEYAQPLLRIIALAAGWSLTLSVAIYSLFASRFLGYGQSQLSAVFSAGAATTIATQIFIVPRLVKSAGEHLSATLGLLLLTMGLVGTSLIRVLPFHTMLYMLIRVGQGITDTSTATLVARASNGKEERARNLGMIQSTRAGARIFTPLVSGSLFSRSCLQQFPTPGSLPYLINAGLALALTPLPLVLRRMEKKSKQPSME
jgi:MFS family permease